MADFDFVTDLYLFIIYIRTSTRGQAEVYLPMIYTVIVMKDTMIV